MKISPQSYEDEQNIDFEYGDIFLGDQKPMQEQFDDATLKKNLGKI